MLPSSEIVIKPGKSKLYLRLVFLLYLLTVGLVIYSSIYLSIKIALISSVFILAVFDLQHQSPCFSLLQISYHAHEWHLLFKNGTIKSAQELRILIHNPLFHLIRLSGTKKNTLFILFNDQVTTHHLRILHLSTDH